MKAGTSNTHYSTASHESNFPESIVLHEFKMDKPLMQINNLIDLAVSDQCTKRTNKSSKRSLSFKKVACNHVQPVKKISLPQLCVYYHLCQLF